jgi:hypothetical protein
MSEAKEMIHFTVLVHIHCTVQNAIMVHLQEWSAAKTQKTYLPEP